MHRQVAHSTAAADLQGHKLRQQRSAVAIASTTFVDPLICQLYVTFLWPGEGDRERATFAASSSSAGPVNSAGGSKRKDDENVCTPKVG